jgi:hypothetical protein
MTECQSSQKNRDSQFQVYLTVHIFCTDAKPIQQCIPKASEDVVGVAMEEPVGETYETYPVEISWAQDGSIVFLLQEN